MSATPLNPEMLPVNTPGHLVVSLGRNTLLGIIARLAQVGTRFVTIPIVIAHLGLAGYGIWSIIMTITAYMRFGSVGVRSAFQKYVAEATETGDFETTNQLLSTGCAAMLVLSLAGLIPIAALSTPLAEVAGVPPVFMDATASSISIMALIMALSNVGSVFEAILMGGHRTDVVRSFTTAFTLVEAAAMIIALQVGYGLLAMSCIMAASEVGLIVCCYLASKKLLPCIHVSPRYITTSSLRELVRFAGSYQLVHVLEICYVAIIPFVTLRSFGADTAGLYAVITRLVGAAMMLSDPFLQPLLSGGAVVYASGNSEGMKRFITNAFRVNLALTLLPLSFLAIFGEMIIYGWTGQQSQEFSIAVPLVCLAGFLQSFSLLQLVLYRVSGRALLDNVRQVLRIVSLVVITAFSTKLGFWGVLSGLVIAELAGALLMLSAVSHTYVAFRAASLLPIAAKMVGSSVLSLLLGCSSLAIPWPVLSGSRAFATAQWGIAGLICVLSIWPTTRSTGAVSESEWKQLLEIIRPDRLVQALFQKDKA